MIKKDLVHPHEGHIAPLFKWTRAIPRSGRIPRNCCLILITKINLFDKFQYIKTMNIASRKLAGLILVIIFIFFGVFFGIRFYSMMTVPANENIAVKNGGIKNFAQADFGGNDFSEIKFDTKREKCEWLALCYPAFGIDDAEDVCQGFDSGYLRLYTKYVMSDKTEQIGGLTFWTEEVCDGKSWRDLPSEDKKKISINSSLYFWAIKYNTAEEARKAVSFLKIDANYTEIAMDGIKIVGSEGDGVAHYAIPADQFVIVLMGYSGPVKEAAGSIIKDFKTGI